MSCRSLTPLLALVLLGILWPHAASAASSHGIYAEVIVCGSTAAEYRHRRTNYVEARDGCEYSIRLVNNTSDRVAIHLSVDGLNTIDASRISASRGPRWVLEPYQSATIPGWQTSSGTSRNFYFTTTDESYADWIGDTSDAGLIRIVAYRERRPTPPPVYIEPGWDYPYRGRDERSGGSSYQDWDAESDGSRKHSAAEAAPRAGATDSMARERRTWYDDRAATGIGQERWHQVQTTSFDAESSSFARITLRYGFHSQLVSWGVLPRYHDPCYCYDGYAPDPNDYWDCRCR